MTATVKECGHPVGSVFCRDCVDAEANAIRAQLAAAKENNRESEEQHAHDCDQFNRLAQEKADAEKERDEYKSAWVYAVKQFAEATMRRGAQLAAVEKERDDMKRELDAAVNHVEFGLLPQREQLRVELAAANERVKALEAGYAQALADDLTDRKKAGNCPSCGWAGGHSNACGTITDAERRGYDKGYSEGLERGREVEDADATDAEVRAHGMGQKDGYRDGYIACTADVVVWLERTPRSSGRDENHCQGLAWALKRGKHVGAAGKGKP